MIRPLLAVLPGTAGPRPTLPTGGRMGEVSRRSTVLQSDDASASLNRWMRPPRVGRGPTVVANSTLAPGLRLFGPETVHRTVSRTGLTPGTGAALCCEVVR